MIERLARYVATRSVSRDEAALAEIVSDDLKSAGCRVHRHGNNVWCEIGDAPRPRLLFNSHLDTVPPGNGWSEDPWTPRRAGDRLIGLGANDAKGCVVALLEAALALHRRMQAGERLGGTIVLALTAEEEITGHGLGDMLAMIRPIDAALVGEPTGLTPLTAQRGLLILKVVHRGRTAHPANTPPAQADNAVMKAAVDLERLRSFEWGAAHPTLGPCHGNVTLIQGGIARNVIPDECTFWIDVRTTPLEPHRRLFERVSAAMSGVTQIHSDRLTPIETADAEPIVQACMTVTGAAPAGSPAMSDMVFLTGIPAVKIGPGDTRRSHTPDEYVHGAEVAAGAAAYEAIALRYFGDPAVRENLKG